MRKLRRRIISIIFCSLFSTLSFAQTTPNGGAAALGRAFLDGVFIAPPGTTVVLQKDGAEEMTLTASKDGNAEFSRNPFKFPNAFANGTPYSLAIKSASVGQ